MIRRVTVEWPDAALRTWRAVFSLDPAKPLTARSYLVVAVPLAVA